MNSTRDEDIILAGEKLMSFWIDLTVLGGTLHPISAPGLLPGHGPVPGDRRGGRHGHCRVCRTVGHPCLQRAGGLARHGGAQE